MRIRWAALLVAGILVATVGGGDDAKKEQKKLEGTWTAVSMEKDGEKIPDATVKELKLQVTLKEGNYTKMDGKVIDKGTGKADPTKKPRTTDIMPTEGPNKGKTIKAIYELDGDTLKVCYDLEGKGRPKAFETKADTGYVLIVYKRAKE